MTGIHFYIEYLSQNQWELLQFHILNGVTNSVLSQNGSSYLLHSTSIL